MNHPWTRFSATAALMFLSLACANPADNVPAAKVSETTTKPAQAASAPKTETTTFVFTPDSKIEFIGSKVTGSHDGGFHEFSGRVDVVNGNVEASKVEVEIDTRSLWSDSDRLTGHLKSADFFEVETYPTATFQSTSIKPSGDAYEVTGDLTLHGVTKSITFPAQISLTDSRAEVNAEFAINRMDFDIVYPGRPNDLIREEVVIKLNVGAAPKQAG